MKILGVWFSSCLIVHVALAQTINRRRLRFRETSNLCGGRARASRDVCVTLDDGSTQSSMIDVFFLLDDTTTFEDEVARLQANIEAIIDGLYQNANADVAYGIGRFQDYGGEAGRLLTGGAGRRRARPFILNQPIVTVQDAGGIANLQALITAALSRTSTIRPGRDDSPQTAFEALYQAATGDGFDGNNDNNLLGNNGRQTVGRTRVETNPDNSGDVPPFSSIATLNTFTSSGSVGGAGFRPNAVKIIVLGTDICSVAPFDADAGSVPLSVSSIFATLFSPDFACTDGARVQRFGLVGDVVPEGGHDVQETVNALVQEGIHVVGMARGAAVQIPGRGSSDLPSQLFSSLARITNAVNQAAVPYIIPITDIDTEFQNNIVTVVEELAANSGGTPGTSTIQATTDCAGLNGVVAVNLPGPATGVNPGETRCFSIEFSLTQPRAQVLDTCTLSFVDPNRGVTYGGIDVIFECNGSTTPEPTSDPTSQPTSQPTSAPTSDPTSQPTSQPTAALWNSIGNPLLGSAALDQFGESVALSQDGSILAVGAINADVFVGGQNLAQAGRVRVYQYFNSISNWDQLGQDLDGQREEDQFGQAVALSSNGLILAVGGLKHDGGAGSLQNSGHVRAYLYSPGVGLWTNLGAPIDGEAAGDFSGRSVALSSDGLTVAIGAVLNDGNGNASGQVRVFGYRATQAKWNQRGNDIDGLVNGDQFGQSVALSADGSIVAIGTPFNDGVGSGTFLGHVLVFQYAEDPGDAEDEGDWTQIGQTISGASSYDQMGNSVDLSSNGNILAIGSHGIGNLGTFSSGIGLVRVYELQGNSWVQRGQDLSGQNNGDQFGFQVSLSNDGTVLAVGGNTANNSVGQVLMYEYSGSQWVQLGPELNGNVVETFGSALTLSGDGNIVAGGGRSNSQNGANSGIVRVFERRQ